MPHDGPQARRCEKAGGVAGTFTSRCSRAIAAANASSINRVTTNALNRITQRHVTIIAYAGAAERLSGSKAEKARGELRRCTMCAEGEEGPEV